MEKLKYIKIEHQDGTLSENVPIGVDANNVDVGNEDLSTKLNRLDANDTSYSNSITSLQSQVSSLASGSPLVANSTASMTDTTKTYVNTTNGYWYYYNGSSWVQGGVYLPTENADNSINIFRFPPPSGYSDTSYIMYDSVDRFEKILTKFDEVGFNVWLQVEPGNNDLVKLATIVFKRYGHHSCIKGFGIDLEWWYTGETGSGKKLSDDDAKRIVDYVRSINPEYTLYL